MDELERALHLARSSPSFAFSQYSIALTSWLVSASMSLMCVASFSVKPATSRSSAATVWRENGLQLADAPLGGERLEPGELHAHAVADERGFAEVGPEGIGGLLRTGRRAATAR